MSTRRRWMLAALLSSVAFNTAGIALLIKKARHAGDIRHVAQKLRFQHQPEINYPRLARERFGWLPRTTDDVVFMGDSHIEHAPLADLVTNVKQLGIGGQGIADVRSWVGQVLATPPRQLVLLAGTSDVLRNRSAPNFARDYDDLLAEVAHRAPTTKVVVMTIPPLTGPAARRVPEFNVALQQVVGRHDYRLVDLHGPLADESGALNPTYSDDGVHLNSLGYAQAAQVFVEAAAVG